MFKNTEGKDSHDESKLEETGREARGWFDPPSVGIWLLREGWERLKCTWEGDQSICILLWASDVFWSLTKGNDLSPPPDPTDLD